MPKVIALDEVSDGMELAEPIFNNHGQTLLHAGVKLDSRYIRILRTWNIMSVTIKEREGDEKPKISENILDIARQRLVKRMAWKPRNVHEKDLFDSAVEYHAKLLLIQNKNRP